MDAKSRNESERELFLRGGTLSAVTDADSEPDPEPPASYMATLRERCPEVSAHDVGYAAGYAECAANFAPDVREAAVKLLMAVEDAQREAELAESPHPDSYALGYLESKARLVARRLDSLAEALNLAATREDPESL